MAREASGNTAEVLAAEQAASALLTAQSQTQASFHEQLAAHHKQTGVCPCWVHLLLTSATCTVRHGLLGRSSLQAEANRQLQAEVDALRAAKAAADAATEGHGREVTFQPTADGHADVSVTNDPTPAEHLDSGSRLWWLPAAEDDDSCTLQAADLGAQLTEAQTALASAQARIGELEAVRRKLHNAVLVGRMDVPYTSQRAALLTLPPHNVVPTLLEVFFWLWRHCKRCKPPLMQELKGNIRVFCRVRPAAESENGETACEVPASGDGAPSSPFLLLFQHQNWVALMVGLRECAEVRIAGRALNLMVPAGDRPGNSERYSFAFDRVFGPAASQVKM